MTPKNKTLLRRAARIINEHARATFDACKGADGEPFVCGSGCCPVNNQRCEADHAKVVATVKGLRELAK